MSSEMRQPVAETSSMAIISLIASIAGLFIFPLAGSIVGIITGNMAKKEILESGGMKTGEGLAQAGVIIGWVGLGLWGLGILAGIVFGVILPLGCLSTSICASAAGTAGAAILLASHA
jgi:hypothetical protein